MQTTVVCTEISPKELKAMRYRAGLTSVVQAAALFCLPTSTWHQWETGKQNIGHPGLLYHALVGLRLQRELAAREKEGQQ